MVETVSQLLYCKKMVRNPMPKTTTWIGDSEWNGQNSYMENIDINRKHSYTQKIDIIHCYCNTILRIPNQPYRRDFHIRWATSRKPANRTENLWSAESDNEKSKHSSGAWITRHEIHQLRNDVSREIENERNPQENKPNNADVATEGENVDLSHNTIPPEENAIEQPNDINENELLKIKETLVNAYAESIVIPFNKRFNLRKPGSETIKKTWKIFGKS